MPHNFVCANPNAERPPVLSETPSESFQSGLCKIVRQPKDGRLVLLGLHFRFSLFHPAVFSILRETG